MSLAELGRTHLVTYLSGYEGLATAVLYRAAKDLAEGNGHSGDARRFLESAGCEALLANLVNALDLAESEPGVSGLDVAHEMLTGLLDDHVIEP